MGYHNYCMQLFAACMTFNDPVIKNLFLNIPKLSAVFKWFFQTWLSIENLSNLQKLTCTRLNSNNIFCSVL